MKNSECIEKEGMRISILLITFYFEVSPLDEHRNS